LVRYNQVFMASRDFEQLLNEAASAHGIEPEFWDIWGRHHVTSAPAKQAILRAMGVDAETPESLERCEVDAKRREWERIVPPVIVTGLSESIEVPLNVPADRLGERASISVRAEDGSTKDFEVNLWELEQIAWAEMERMTWVRKRARLSIQLPLGYHDIFVQLGSSRGAVRYIVTPDRAWTTPQLGRGGKLAGLAVSLYGVRSARNWGCGDFTDLLEVIDWVRTELQASFVSLNPLHAIHNRRPFNTSPYLPNCSFYQNFIYLDVESIEDFQQSARARALRESREIASEIEELRGTPFVEYERVAAVKLRVLKAAFREFLKEWKGKTARGREFQAYLEREGDLLERFALYSALDEFLHRRNPELWIWPDWPLAYQDPTSEKTQEFRRKHWVRILFYQYLQWQIDLQLRKAQQRSRERSLAIGLYHDLALATDRFGSDLWAHRRFYITGCRVGAPPDDFAPGGQDWGFPPPHSERHRENGYRLFAESIRKNCRRGGALRIDHVMRLFRLYWIPEGYDATRGAYVHELTDDFVRILALESVRNQVVVIGEDLGTVEPYVRETLARFGILSYRLFYFEKDKEGRFRRSDEYPRQALVSSTTHDLPTLAGFWSGADIEARRAAGALDDRGYQAQWQDRGREKQKMLDLLFSQELMPAHLARSASAYPELTGELHNAIVGYLASTPSQLLAINQEDLTKETAQQNLPGTTWQYPNWGRKMRFTLEQLRNDPEALNYTAMFRHWIVTSGRRNQQS
jgi:4-alpha-glucanotransferase